MTGVMFDLQAKAAALQLLVVEDFAGTYAVARVLQHVSSSVQNALGVRLQAYVGIEVQEALAKKAPSAADLGLDKQHFLNFKGAALAYKPRLLLQHGDGKLGFLAPQGSQAVDCNMSGTIGSTGSWLYLERGTCT